MFNYIYVVFIYGLDFLEYIVYIHYYLPKHSCQPFMNLKTFLKTVKLQESTISMILGVLVVIIVGYIAIRFFANKPTDQVLPPAETQKTDTLPTTHVVESGENLWTISEKYYGNGYNWVDIKEANELANADQINDGQELVIPDVAPRIAQANTTSTFSPTAIPEDTTNPIETQTVPETPTSTPTQSQENVTQTGNETDSHTVEKGESLWKIAQKYMGDGNKWVVLAKENDIDNPGIIRPGQELKLAGREGSITPEAASTSTSSYTVQKGDSLWTIAQGTYGDGNKWVEIAKANNLSHPNIIHSGNSLSIPQ